MILLTIFAAASLTNVFPQIDARQRYSFAGSNQLAAQIRQGAPADVFASANTALPDQLYAEGLVEKPVVFTRNALILIVPHSNPAKLASVYDLRKPGVKLVVAARGVPVGDYTRTVLHNLALDDALNNVVSNENDVREVLAKVALGEADAGFVYRTDVKPVGNRIFRIGLPAAAQPTVRYELCIPTTSRHPKLAAAFVSAVLSKRGRATLRAAGFGPP
jgi:molybdate transport system substrate-binding protein